MRMSYLRATLALLVAATASAANAQWAVTDTGANTQLGALNTSMGTANTSLQRIARATENIDSTTDNTLDVFKSPTTSLVPTINALDGGGTVEAASDAAEFMPQVNGATATSTTATALVAAQQAAIEADQAMGLKSGDPLYQQAERQRKIAGNLAAEAKNDLDVFARRAAATKAILTKLSTANIKDAIVLSGGVQVEILRQLNLLGQSMSLNTVAVTEGWLSRLKGWFQHRNDHAKAALLFKLPVKP